MGRAMYGVVAGLIGGVVGMVLWQRRAGPGAVRDRGTVIYDNTPTAGGL